LQAPNVEVVPRGVSRITPSGIVDAAGVERTFDTIIFGTGFYATDAHTPDRVYGSAGKSVGETWDGSPEAYMGTTVHGFPNAFFMIGPNTGNGHGSAFVIIEAQANYIADTIDTAVRERIASVEVRKLAQSAWNAQVQQALQTGVFNAGGCQSYYID